MEKIESAKTVFFHRNGINRAPKTVVINPRQTRTLDSLLDKVTATLKTPGAVRNIRTPTGRHRISKLEQLVSERAYVAVGNEGFKRIDYSSLNQIGSGRPAPPRKELEVIEPVKHNTRIVVSGRARKIGETEPLGNKTIYVYANGDTLTSAKAILLKKNNLKSLDKVLKEVNEKVELQTGAVRWLYVLKSGYLLKDSSELENKEDYVAVGSEKKLKKGNYSSQSTLQLTPRRVSVKLRIPPVKRGIQTQHKTAKPHPKKKYPEVTHSSQSEFTDTAVRETAAREATRDSIKRESTQGSPSFLEQIADKINDVTDDNEKVAREATRDSIKRESTQGSPSFLEQIADKINDVTDGNEKVSREATRDSIKRESTKDSPSFLEQVVDKVSDFIDGDDSSEDGDRRESTDHRGVPLQDNRTYDEADDMKTVFDASGQQEVKGEVVLEDRDTVENKPIDLLSPEEVTEEQIEDEENAQ